MTIADSHDLESRLAAGEELTDEFRRLHSLARESIRGGDDMFPWAESFALAFHHKGLFPALQAAKALVDVALAADETMPVVAPYDTQMKNALSPAERAEMFVYIARRIGENRSPQSFSAAADFADYLIDVG